jgi:large subunit ribosomal protein L4
MARQEVAKAQQTDGMFTVLSPNDLGLVKEAKRKNMSPAGFAIAVRALLQNWRQGTVACKGRSDVSFSNKKPWKQKGTGRARAGSARSPLWRGGGVCFGPQPRTRVLKVTKSLRKNVLNNLFYDYAEQGKIVALDWTAGEAPKTALASKMLKNAKLHGKNINIFVLPTDVLTYASFVNIPKVRVLFFDQPNAFDLANNGHWVFLKKDENAFKEMVSRWI